MPGIGNPVLRRQGLDVLQHIRQLGINAPVLMMSGDYERRKEADAMTQGAFAYRLLEDDLICLEENLLRNREPQCLRCLTVDDQLETPSHRRTVLRAIASKTGCRSPGELKIARRISFIAASRWLAWVSGPRALCARR